MTLLYYYLVMLNALTGVAVAVVVFWKNRHQTESLLLCLTMLGLAVWLVGFAQYFRVMDDAMALRWASVTLAASIFLHPLWFQTACALVGGLRRYRWLIILAYVMGLAFLLLLWGGGLVVSVKSSPYMHHYIHYNRAWYPALIGHLLIWQVLGVGVMGFSAWRSVGYKRTQLIYYIAVWLIIFLTTHSIILPIEYDINIQPFGFFVLPLNLLLLAYVMSKARLADFNVVIARVLLHTVTLLVIALASFGFVAGLVVIAPGFMNPQQILFTIVLIVVIGVGLTVTLPYFLPRAERMMQERMFGKRYGYQDALAGLVKELSLLPNIDEVLNKVATAIHSQMQVSRVMILLQDMLSGDYKLQAGSGLGSQDDAQALALKEDSAIVKWLQNNKDALVREEMALRARPRLRQRLEAELDRLKVNVCVPMILEQRLVGLLCLGEKLSRDMFFISDLHLLEILASEVALAVKYRRMEDEVFRKNRLVDLGTIAAGVAHEIRNPLASIKTFAQLMPERMDDPEFKNEFSKLVLKDVDRITKVIESMLAFARPTQVTIAEHSVSDLVEEAVLLVQSRLKFKGIELTKQFHEQPMLRVDKQQILQVLVNLLINAADVLPEHGKIRIATGVRAMEDTEEGNGNQRFAVIEIADNGPGIPAAVRNRLFDPFFTTKKEGTGLGLSISQKIVRDHGGIITVSSVEGKGTAFQVNLPLA